MKTSEKVRNISPDPFCKACADEVAQLENALETIKNYATGACIGIDLEGEGFKGEGTLAFMIEETAIQALKND